MSARDTPARRIVSLAGDARLVAEFATVCAQNGFAVEIVAMERGRGSQKALHGMPKTIRVVNRPARGSALAIELTNIDREAKRRRLALLDRALPAGTLLLSSSVTVALSEQSGWVRHPGRLVGIGALPGFLGGEMIECAHLPLTEDAARERAGVFVRSLGKEAAFIGDSVGMVLPRVVCCLANEAHFALMEQVAGPDEIDTAMQLGTNYPAGPFAWARKIGFRQVYAVMDALHQSFGEERYRPAPALKRAAEAEEREGPA